MSRSHERDTYLYRAICPVRQVPQMNNKPVAKLRTPGVLAADLGVPLHRVQYILQTRDHIQPAARAGRLRLYDREAVALIRHEINAIDARRSLGASS